jgi:hypothetical protein
MKTPIRTVDRHLIKGLPFEFPAGFLFVFATPLFEEEDFCGLFHWEIKKSRPRMGPMFIERKA